MYQPRHRGGCPLLRRKFLALLVLLATAVSPVQAQQPDPSVCNRTEQVRDAIVASVSSVSHCAYVTDVHLAGIGILALGRSFIETLQEGDFAGLTALKDLNLDNNNLTVLPARVFAGLTALELLDLEGNDLTVLPAGVFAGLTALKDMELDHNRLAAFPAGVFSGLTALKLLHLNDNLLTALPAGVFSGLTALEVLYLEYNNLMELSADAFSGLPNLQVLNLGANSNQLTALPEGVFSGLTALEFLGLQLNGLTTLTEGVFAGLTGLRTLYLNENSLTALPVGVFSGLTALETLYLSGNNLMELSADVFSGLPRLQLLSLHRNSLTALPGGVFSGLTALNSTFLSLGNNPGSEGFQPIANAGADQTAGADQVVTLTATVSDDDPWGDNVRYVWTRTDNSGSDLTLMDAETASPSFVMPAGATELEFELRVTGRGGDDFVDTDILKVRHPDAVVTLTGPEPAATTTNIVENSINLVYTYSAADLHGRILAGKIEVAAAIDGVAITPDINIDEASGQGEVTVVLRRQEYPGPIGHLLAVTLSLSAAAEGFVLGEPSSMTTTFSFFSSVDPSVCDRTPQVRDAIVASVPVSHCAYVTNVHLADIVGLSLSGSSVETLQEGDFAGLTALGSLYLNHNSLRGLPLGLFSGLPALVLLNLSNNSLEALPAGIFSELPTLRLLYLYNNSLTALPGGVFAGLPLEDLYLHNNSLTALPEGVFSGLTALNFLFLGNNPGSEGFRPIANAGADQTAGDGQVVTLTATVSGDDPWGDNVRYAWTQTDNSGNVLPLMGADTASPSFVMPAGATELEFELRVTGRGGDHFVDTASLKVRHPDAVVTLTGPEPAAPTTEIVENEFSLVFTYSAADLHGRVPAGKIEVTAAVDGVAVTPDINIDEARGQGEITVVLRRQEYPGPIGHLLAVTLRLSASAAAEGFVLGEPSSITTPFSFFSSVDPSVCARTPQVRDAIVASVPVSHCAYVTNVHLADIVGLSLSGSSVETLQEGDFAGLPALGSLYLNHNSLRGLPLGLFSGLPALVLLDLSNNSLDALPAGVFSGLTALNFLFLGNNPGSEGFRPMANAGADQTSGDGQVVTLTATVSGDDPWGDNVRYVWTRTDNSGSDLTLMDAETASPSFVMPAGATGLEFELRVTGRGGDNFVDTDSLKVRHPDAVVTLTGPEPAATTDIGGDSINLVYTYSAADLHGRILAGKIEVAAAIDGVAITPDINIDEASAQGEVTVVLRREAYPNPDGHSLAVTLSLSAAADGFALGEPSSMTTTFSFRALATATPDEVAVTDTVVTLTGPEPAATTTDIVDNSISLVYIYSADNLYGRILTGKIEVAAAIDGVAITPDINIDEASAQGEVTVVLRREAYPNPDGHSLAVTLSLSAAADGFVLGEPSSMTTTFSFRALATATPDEVAVTDTVVTLTGPEPAATTTDIVDNSISLVYIYSADNLYGRILTGKIEVAAAIDGVAITPDINIDEASAQGEVTVVLRREAYPNPDGHSLAVTLSLSAAADGFVLGEPSSMTTTFSFRALATATPDEVAVTDTVVTLTGPEPAATTTDIVDNSISLVYIYSADNLYGRILTGKIEVAAAIDGVAITPDINIDEASAQGEVTVVLRREAYPNPDGHSLAVTLSLSAAADGFALGETSSITTPFSFGAVDVPDTVLTLSGPEQVTTTGIVQGYISLLYTFAADNLRGRALTGNFEVTAAVDGVALTPAIHVDETGGMGEITVVLKRESYPGPGSHSLAVTLSLSAAADGFALGETSSITTPFSFGAVDVPDTVLTLSGPEQVTTTGIVQGYISLLYTFAADNLRGRALTGNFEVTAAVDGVALTPAIHVDETGGMGEITVVLKRESYPAPGSHSLAVTLSLSAVAADGFALGEISSITTLFRFSLLSTAIAEDGTCQLGMLELGESCRYKGSSMIMSVPQAGSQVLFFELSGRGEPLNLKDASNPDDPDDPNVYNLHAIMVGRGYQIIRIYTSPKNFLKTEFGSMGGAAILWAALFFFADFARGLAGRRAGVRGAAARSPATERGGRRRAGRGWRCALRRFQPAAKRIEKGVVSAIFSPGVGKGVGKA